MEKLRVLSVVTDVLSSIMESSHAMDAKVSSEEHLQGNTAMFAVLGTIVSSINIRETVVDSADSIDVSRSEWTPRQFDRIEISRENRRSLVSENGKSMKNSSIT